MYCLIIRTMPKNKLAIMLHLPSQIKQFERSSVETVEGFIKRLSKSLNNEVQKISIVDRCGNAVNNSAMLVDALIPTNSFVINSVNYKILLNPSTIVQIKIPDTRSSGLVLFAAVELIDLNIDDISYNWEACSSPNSWEVVSTSKTLFLSPQLTGCMVRLACNATGVETVYSNIIGPVIDDESTNILLARAVPVASNSTRVMCYNILADGLMESKSMPIRNFFPYCPKQYQIREYRESRIAAEVWAHNPHILCMQEVEDYTFRESLVPSLPAYTGYIAVIRGRFRFGCAIFFRHDQFQEVHYEHFPLPDLYNDDSSVPILVNLGQEMKEKFPEIMKDIKIRPVVSQIAVLRDIVTEKLIIVGNTHLYWDPAYHIIALMHVHAMCTKIADIKESHESQGEDINVIICGDMNSQTSSLVHSYLTNGLVSQDGTSLYDYLSHNVRNPLKLKLGRGEPNYTNYTANFKAVIDYVLCDDRSKVSQVTPSPKVSDLEKSDGCPSAIFPSDHLPIISDIVFGGA